MLNASMHVYKYLFCLNVWIKSNVNDIEDLTYSIRVRGIDIIVIYNLQLMCMQMFSFLYFCFLISIFCI